MKLRYPAVAAVMALLLSPAVQAKDEGLYIGASLGSASVNQSGSNPDWDDFSISGSDFAYKLFGGYQFTEVFALEGGYRDLGKSASRTASTETEGIDVVGVVGLPVGPVRVFGKLGAIYWDSSTRLLDDAVRLNNDSFDFTGGVGLEFEFLSIGIRGEIEYLDVHDDTWMYSVGATLTF
ncbi:MAG: outer membrane beta-barrel protein [Xanthomonadales bacterium]|jgi:hypothetical protein|nr:outer membrane beta-barrel protein [Xanthomonadales bacterium]